ncbi:MAG: histidine phosphatase family protein [SAR324 cluster bacterium]|nr:histidine phosphatase family protein [SAR324 cluster bacterium]
MRRSGTEGGFFIPAWAGGTRAVLKQPFKLTIPVMPPDNPHSTSITITRHGESEHNLITRVFMGRSPNSMLTETGREQARKLGRRLAGEAAVGQIIASSLPRTMETAALIAEQLGLAEPIADEAFWELDKGDWEGAMVRPPPPEIAQAVRTDPFSYRYGGAESYQDVVGRAAPAFQRWVDKFAGGRLLFVLHGDVIRALLYHLLEFPPHRISDFVIDPCSITQFNFAEGRYELLRLNDAAHISRE